MSRRVARRPPLLSVAAVVLGAWLVRGCAWRSAAFVHAGAPRAQRCTRPGARDPGERRDAERHHTDLALFRRLASETRPYRLHIACIFVISMLAAPLTLLTPVPLAIAVDSVIGSQPLPGFLDAIVPVRRSATRRTGS